MNERNKREEIIPDYVTSEPIEPIVEEPVIEEKVKNLEIEAEKLEKVMDKVVAMARQIELDPSSSIDQKISATTLLKIVANENQLRNLINRNDKIEFKLKYLQESLNRKPNRNY